MSLRNNANRKVMTLELGMTKQEVIDILGKPYARNIKENFEVLDFRNYYDESTFVFFEEGRVVEIQSFDPYLNTPVVVIEKEQE